MPQVYNAQVNDPAFQMTAEGCHLQSSATLRCRSGTEEESAPDGNVVVARLMGGVEYGRPLATGWTGTLGVNWQRAKCLNEHGNCITQVRLLVAHCLNRPLHAITCGL